MKILFYLVLAFAPFVAAASDMSGIISDAESKETLIGAHLHLKHTSTGAEFRALSGLDGSYRIQDLPAGAYDLQITFIGYTPLNETVQITDANTNVKRDFSLRMDQFSLNEVVIQGDNSGSDAQARRLERASPNVVNMISAKQITLSPDLTVANVIQRVSGLSIERNASGDPQYAVVRGMDKRYNNTLVNGIKIPSPDNENRYVPLDIFPAVLLERLEVYKSLSANMEADAIGGTVNMVMKSAPSEFFLDADLQFGYNQLHFERDFATYDRSKLNKKSPSEIHGAGYRATPSDFPVENMTIEHITPMPDVFANVSYGDRFLDKKLGVMLGGSFQNSYRPVNNYFYDPGVNSREGNPLIMRDLIERQTSSQLQRIAFHGKLDYRFNAKNNLSFYAGKFLLNEFRVRDQFRQQSFVVSESYAVYPITRFSNIFQDITIFDLRGEHKFSPVFSFDWSGIYSTAKNDRPDDGVFSRAGERIAATNEITNEIVYFQGTRNSRTWERNKDTDLSLYLNFRYNPGIINEKTEIQFGGVARNKVRDNYFNYYNYSQVFGQFRGEDWDEFGDVAFTTMANPLGSGDRSNLVYDATESIYAGYVNTKWEIGSTNIEAGVRAEQTVQTYEINPTAASASDVALSQEQDYLDLFPSVSIKQRLTPKANLKASYFKAISRPGFYEIVPTIRSSGGGDGLYSERGNANLRPSYGHSADLRYEFFPSGVDQILVGVFYKHIVDPIEYGFPQITADNENPTTNQILPQNFDDATNIGLEADYTKYFNRLGIRLNYTYTKSSITTNKIVLNEDGSSSLVNQTRSLQGQSDHIGNVSLLWKDQKNLLDAQLVVNYTGERIAFVSPYFGADHIMSPMVQLDISVEKGFKGGWVLFMKVNNLLNTPYQLYVDKPLAVPDDPYPHQTDPHNSALVRRDLYGQSYRIGVRYNLIRQ